MMPSRSRITRTLPLLGCLVAFAFATAAAAANARVTAAAAGVRSCGRGEVQEYPYFNVRARGTPCAVAQHVIRRFLCTNARGHDDRGP